MTPTHKTLLAILAAFLLTACAPDGNLIVTNLTCEYMPSPNSIDVARPRLSWINEPVSADLRNETQTAYRILVASSKRLLDQDKADLWDSGKVLSADSYLVPYGGGELTSGQSCYWKVMTWDARDRGSAWSRTALWTMGMMDESGWKAKWIGAPYQEEAFDKEEQPAPLFRKTFSLKGKVKEAKAFVVGLGYFDFYVNSKRINQECLIPNFTDYTERPGLGRGIIIPNQFRQRRVMYLVYDITEHLRKGDNAMGLVVGNGFFNTISSVWAEPYGSPRMLCQVEITYKDGSHETILSDTSWKCKPSAITMNNLYKGETYDARLETPLWASASLDDASWQNAVERVAPSGRLEASSAPLDRVTETLKPVSLLRQEDGSYLVDFGVEISGWIRFKDLVAPAGQEMSVEFICESPVGKQTYIFKGEGKESYAPRFAWYVFSKAVIKGAPELRKENLVAEAVGTDVRVNSSFSSSNPILEQINTIWKRSQMDNMHGGIASDCPHREKTAYTGDGEVASGAVMTNFDAAAFYKKWIRDMNYAQNPIDGYVPNSAPWQPRAGGGVAWGAAMNVIPWEFYCQYGDRSILEENYQAMKDQVRYMSSWETPDGTMHSQRQIEGGMSYWINLGDWCPPGENPSNELVHTFYYWYCTRALAESARVLGNDADYAVYDAKANAIRTAFHDKFYDPDIQSYGQNGSNVFALAMGVPSEVRDAVVESLRKEIQDDHDSHLTTGIYGTRFLFEVLSRNGLHDLALEVMSQKDFPSFGYFLSQGSTVTWEQWDGGNSHNHPMFGGGLTWLYSCVGGINYDALDPGYHHIIIRPVLFGKLEEVNCEKMTPFGTVRTHIVNKDGKARLSVTVPVGATATVDFGGKVQNIGQGTYEFGD